MDNVLALMNEEKKDPSQIEWEKPISFDEDKLPEFDVSIFPEWLRDYIKGVSESTQTSVDVSVMASIAMLSTILAKQFEINPRGDWHETLNTYTVLALPSANRKSGVFKEFTYPIIEYEKKQGEELEIEIAKQLGKKKALEKRKEHLQAKYGKEKKQEILKEIDTVTEEIESEKIIHKPRYSTSDATPEVLADLMRKNNEKIAILSAEGGEAFDMMAGRYSSSGKPNIDIYLKGHSVDDVAIDRIGREPIKLYSPTLTIGLFLQPDVVKNIPEQFQERGLTQRFLYSFPRSWLGFRNKEPDPVSSNVREKFESSIQKLLRLKTDNPVILTLSEEANNLRRANSYEIEEMLKDEDNTDAFQGWIGKLEGQMLRTIALIHIAKYASSNFSDIPTVIEVDIVQYMKGLREYFVEHAKKAHGIMGVDSVETDAKQVLKKINTIIQKKKEKTNESITKIDHQELWQLVKKMVKKSSRLDEILINLEDRNFIKIDWQGRKKIILINPMLMSTTEKNNPKTPNTN
ncbi:YfjI family protein [Lentibacillus sediminis]|uniref:YfjI family protein n=1 Tax=Lentibacillus sediminis TaxID=1940529 RepID=UPI000C1C7802|nr:YfjI family protein [Lentibacillus sediminis]